MAKRDGKGRVNGTHIIRQLTDSGANTSSFTGRDLQQIHSTASWTDRLRPRLLNPKTQAAKKSGQISTTPRTTARVGGATRTTVATNDVKHVTDGLSLPASSNANRKVPNVKVYHLGRIDIRPVPPV
jgi:hypothetical protein